VTIHAEIAQCFYKLTEVKGHPASALLSALRDLLTEDFSSTGPLLKIEGREQYLDLLGRALPAQVSRRFHHQFADANQICSLYDLTVRHPGGENRTIPMVDWLTVYQGRIRRQVLYYDPRRFAATSGLEYSPAEIATSSDRFEATAVR
jgi:hypothetical protein